MNQPTHDQIDFLPELDEADMAELLQRMQRATGRIVNVFQAVLGLLLGGFAFAVIFLGLTPHV